MSVPEARETAKQMLIALPTRLKRYTRDAEAKIINDLFSKNPFSCFIFFPCSGTFVNFINTKAAIIYYQPVYLKLQLYVFLFINTTPATTQLKTSPKRLKSNLQKVILL